MDSGRFVFDPNFVLAIFSQNRDFLFKISVGGTINALSLVLFVFNPLFFPVCLCLCALTQGYVLLVMHTLTDKGNVEFGKLPEWPSPFTLLVPGLSWLALAFGSLLIIVLLVGLSLGIGLVFGPLYGGGGTYLAWVLISLVVISLFILFISFWSSYLMVGFASSEKPVFNIQAVARRFMREPVAFIQAWLMSLGMKWIAVLLPLLTIIGICFIPLLLFVAEIISGALLAQVWNESDR